MPILRIRLKERSYPVLVAKNALMDAGRWLLASGFSQKKHLLVVTQKEVAVYYQPQLADTLAKFGFQCSFFLAPHGKSSEASKSVDVLLKLIRKIASCDGHHRSVALVALGGGVVGDLTGFAASIYRRGIPYVQLPTTLTAQVDSSIGGKTAVDIAEGKNLVGSIYQPALVLSDVSLLSSLPERHWSDGFAEVIKYGVIEDRALFTLLEREGQEGIRRSEKRLTEVIFRCARIKGRLVEKDELDKKGLRMALNFGHTVGHALEAASGFSKQLTHGEAVGIGMLAACDIAAGLGVLEDETLSGRLEKLLLKFNLPVVYRGIPKEQVLKALGYDKKAENGVNRFVLPRHLGKVMIVPNVPQGAIVEALERRKA
jgi:3-dehydroquinate synthase